MKKHILTGFLCLSCLYLPNLALANDDDEETIEIGDINVYGQEYQVSGSATTATTITSEEIQLVPTVNNNVTEVLRSQSSIQFDSASRDSTQGAELGSSKISINGARYFENNFTINGLNNNNYLDSSGLPDAGQSVNSNPTGDSQSLFIDTSLLGSIEVYSDNISSQYGDFVGGVVNSTLRDAKMDSFHGSISYDYTSDKLASFHWTDANLESIESAEIDPSKTNAIHNEFTKANFTAILEGPIWRNIGAIGSYTRNSSTIPFYSNVATGNNEYESTRVNENFMLRLNTSEFDDKLYLAITAIHAPYENVRYSDSFSDGGEYSFSGGGTTFMLNNHYDFSFARLKNDISYSLADSTRESDTNIVVVGLTSVTGFSATNTGGYGTRKMSQDTLNWKSILEFEPIGNTIVNNILLGYELKHINVNDYNSGYKFFSAYSFSADTSASGSLSDGVIDGKGYITSVNYAPEYETSASVFTSALFFEDTMKFERLTLRPGVRASYDTIVKDINIAPRLFANFDILNNKKYNLFGGYNRYYGSQLLTKAIYTTTGSTGYKTASSLGVTNFDGFDWDAYDQSIKEAVDAKREDHSLGNLDTPYTDELALGASASVLDTFVKLNYVHRDNKDQIKECKDGLEGTYYYTNDGKSAYNGITLSLDRSFDFNKLGFHNMGLSATYSNYTGNFTSYTTTDSISIDKTNTYYYSQDYAYLDGKKVSTLDLPANSFNSPLVIVYSHNASFFNEDRLRLFAQLRWEMGGERLLYSFDDGNNEHKSANGLITYINAHRTEADGFTYYTYTLGQQDHITTCDLALEFDALKFKGTVLTLEASAINIFNTKNATLSNSSTYKVLDADNPEDSLSYSMGRQFYLGGKYTF